jgi:hypothetical protein
MEFNFDCGPDGGKTMHGCFVTKKEKMKRINTMAYKNI